MTRDVVGYIIGDSTISQATFISKGIPKVGQYVILEYDGTRVLGMVQALFRGSISLTEDIHDPNQVEKIKELERGRTQYIRGVVKILGDIEGLNIPRVPPPPGTELYRATKEVLRRVFGDYGKCIRIGTLASEPDVPVHIDVNKMISRHLAILAITGAGKSNTVAVIVDELLKLGGTALIFDMHSEYIGAVFTNGEVNAIAPRINPLFMNRSEFLRLMNIDRKAYIQERFFRKAFANTAERIRGGAPAHKFLDMLEDSLTAMLDEGRRRDTDSIIGVINKLEDFREKYGSLIDPHVPSVADQISPGKANVVDLGKYDEEAADVVVSHFLRTVMAERKRYITTGRGLRVPIFIVIEEAHILAPRDRPTLSKYWISRVAREGRKFGVGLCLVSQRPKNIDSNALSQANNMIVLRLVEPSDQRYVQQASETLSEDLLQQLSSLNVGEAVVLGLMIRVPAVVKIDKFEGRLVGEDIDIVGEWLKALRDDKYSIKELDDLTQGW